MANPAAGWYPDPTNTHRQRWWSGTTWTEHIAEPDPSQQATKRHPAPSGFTERQVDGVPLATVHPAAIPAAIGAFFLLVALVGAEYEFYVVMRWAVTAMAMWVTVVAATQKNTVWVILFIAIALLFNPLIPVYSTREFWIPIDLAGAVFFGMAGAKIRALKPAPPGRLGT